MWQEESIIWSDHDVITKPRHDGLNRGSGLARVLGVRDKTTRTSHKIPLSLFLLNHTISTKKNLDYEKNFGLDYSQMNDYSQKSYVIFNVCETPTKTKLIRASSTIINCATVKSLCRDLQ